MGSRSDGWGEPSCEWEDASAWLRSGGSTSGFSSRLAASEAPRSGGLADRTNAPSPAPREGRDALTPEQKARIAANREAALARKRRRLEDAARARAGDRGASRRLDATPAFREPPRGLATPPTAPATRLATPPRHRAPAEDLASRGGPRGTPPRRPSARGAIEAASPPAGEDDTAVSSFPRSPRPVPAPKPLAVALDAAFDGVARDDPRGPATDESTRRPRWLLAPTDDAGRARPTEPRPPELRDVSATPRFDPSSLRVDAKDLATRSKFARQFWAIKSRLMDCVVMCRHGSFYNLFDVDADVGMSVGLRLSGKPAAFMQKVGCFHDAFDAWAGKILARGYAVARIEETSEKNAEGIVRREIAEILTPALARGLVGAANADRPEALLALAESSDAADAAAADASLDASVSLGVAVLDAEAGEVLLGSFADGPERDHLRAFLALVEPREVVFSRRRKEGKLSPATLAALRRHARDAEDDERLAGEAGSGGALGGGLGLFRSSRTSIACRAIERGAAPLPDFDREDVVSAAARFAGIDPNAAPPPAVAAASPVATEALAYLIRHVAWAGAAGRALAGARFRTLRGSVRTLRQDATSLSNEASNEAVANRPERRFPAEAIRFPAEAIRLDASTVRSLHLLRGGGFRGDAARGLGSSGSSAAARSGSLLGFLDATFTPPGRRRLREWILQPPADPAAANARHDAVDALCAAPEASRRVAEALASVPGDAAKALASAAALAGELADVEDASVACGAAVVSSGREEGPDGDAAGETHWGAAFPTGWRRRTRGRGDRSSDPSGCASEDEEEAEIAFWAPRKRDARRVVDALDALVASAAALASLPEDPALDRWGRVGRDALADARALRARLVSSGEDAAGGDDDDANRAYLLGRGKNARTSSTKKKRRASRGDGDHTAADDDDAAFAYLAFLPGALPSPGTSRDFDAARDFVLRAAREGDVFGASTLSAAKSAAAAACRVVSATATDLAADRDRWRAVVDAAAEVDVLRAFAERTGPDAKTPPGCAFVRPAFLREDEDVSPRDPEDARLDAGATSSTEASRRLVERGGGGGNRLFLRGSWHPLAARPAAPFVRNDVALGGADAPAMLLTGANMGGKSTLLRQAATAAIMAHLGCRVPASEARLHPVDAVACRSGAGDGVVAGVSTFLAEMSDAACALRTSTRRSLFVADELGRGTSVADGYALAHATLAAIARKGTRCLFATHYHRLAEDVKTTASVPRGAVAAWHLSAETTGGGGGGGDGGPRTVRFTRALAPGPAPLGSCAMNVASLAGVPAKLLRRAEDVANAWKRGEGVPRVREEASEGTLGGDARACFDALAADPVVSAAPGAAADVAWARRIFALWRLAQSAIAA